MKPFSKFIIEGYKHFDDYTTSAFHHEHKARRYMDRSKRLKASGKHKEAERMRYHASLHAKAADALHDIASSHDEASADADAKRTEKRDAARWS